MLKMASAAFSVVHLPATYPRGYDSVGGLPAALLEDHFEHPERAIWKLADKKLRTLPSWRGWN
jgi:hypothetical protein